MAITLEKFSGCSQPASGKLYIDLSDWRGEGARICFSVSEDCKLFL